MKLTDKQIKRAVKGMIRRFYIHNFAPWDLDAIFGRGDNLYIDEYLEKEFGTYNMRETYRELNKLLTNVRLIEKEEKGCTKMHGMTMETL